jgi:hypothetical protein
MQANPSMAVRINPFWIMGFTVLSPLVGSSVSGARLDFALGLASNAFFNLYPCSEYIIDGQG